MDDQNTAALSNLADSLDGIHNDRLIFKKVCDALDIRWSGQTPKQLRRQIAKEISPDRTKDDTAKEVRTRVLATVNHAYDMMKEAKTVSQPLNPVDRSEFDPDNIGFPSREPRNASFKTSDTVRRYMHTWDFDEPNKDEQEKSSVIKNIWSMIVMVTETAITIIRAIIHSPFLVVFIFLFGILVLKIYGDLAFPDEVNKTAPKG